MKAQAHFHRNICFSQSKSRDTIPFLPYSEAACPYHSLHSAASAYRHLKKKICFTLFARNFGKLLTTCSSSMTVVWPFLEGGRPVTTLICRIPESYEYRKAVKYSQIFHFGKTNSRNFVIFCTISCGETKLCKGYGTKYCFIICHWGSKGNLKLPQELENKQI